MGTTLYKNADWIITMNEKREKIRHGDFRKRNSGCRNGSGEKI